MKQPKHRKKVLPKRLKNKYNYPGQALYQETFPPLSAVVSAAAFANCNNNGNSNNNNAAGDGGVRPISCMYTVPIYDTGKESLSFRKVKKPIF